MLAVSPAASHKEEKSKPPAESASPWPEGHPALQLYPPGETVPLAAERKNSRGFSPAFVPSSVGNGLAWIKQMGGSSTEVAQAAAATVQGVYVAGSADGSFNGNTHVGNNDFIVAKVNPNNAVLWTRQYGSPAQDYATGVATYSVTSPHSIYVGGYSAGSMDGNPKVGSAFDGVLMKLDEYGNQQWVRQLNSTNNASDQIFAVATDKLGNVYAAGNTIGTLSGQTPQGLADMFLAKYNPSGVLQWVRQVGTAKNDYARGVAADSEGNIYLAGHSFGSLGGPNQNPSLLTSDMVLIKYDTNGNLVWKRQMGTTTSESVSGVATSRQLNGAIAIYVVGYTSAAYDGQSHSGGTDIFMTQFDKLGNKLWSRQKGTAGNDYPNGLASDGGANLYVAGRTDYDMDTNTPETSRNVFLMKYSAGGVWLFHKQLGSINLLNPMMMDDEGFGVAADINDNVYVAGGTFGEFTNPVTVNGGNDKSDLLVVKYTVGCQDTFTANQCSIGYGWGDPHMVTFDRLSYDFQGAGEFILTKSATGGSFEVQARMEPWYNGASVTVMRAVATRVGADRVGFYQNSTPFVKVNGAGVTLGNGELVPLPGGGRLYRKDAWTYVVYYPGEDRMIVTDVSGSYMNVDFSLSLARMGTLQGLLGNFNGNASDDFRLRNGTSLGSFLTFAQLYTGTNSLASSWRVTTAESLFDYALNMTTSSFTLEDFPLMPVTTASLSPEEREAAEAVCREAGVESFFLLDSCILDVAVTGDHAFAQGAVLAQNRESQSGGGHLPPPVVGPQTIYFAHFNETVGEEWSPGSLSMTPKGEKIFLGEYGEQEAALHLSRLPEHTQITVSFDLLILQGWDGDGPYGPNLWGFTVDGKEVFESTFSNTNSTQSYPKPGSRHGSGAESVNALGYPSGDSLYKMKFTFEHTARDLSLNFYAKGLSGLTGESWGLDGVEVQVR
ncbi:hypothetical protein DB31_4081 [Hyalangium minutum]|uniref:VWFD domain-containing protein n=1 Tax=Hyalangium minutum TaxID=394096 RepID=A0A085W3V8_9BACT|nr:hypothetical protein DB31_4081 [Hyalangium minutum]